MTRKITSVIVFALLAIGAYGQTIVSTSPEDRKVVLEEFTGIHCVWCPAGHAIAQSIQDNNPGEVFLINIHVGGFSTPGAGEPDFRTPWGTAIANQSGLVGYPAGTVNRHLFPGQSQGSGTAMSRGQWSSASNTVMGETSYVNVGVEASIDIPTREMTVHVEAFYTGNSPESTNLLNIALLQNNTLGPQTGGNMGDNYVHQHRLIDMLTGQWGMSIPTTTTGTFVDETITYTIPNDHNGIPIELADLEVVSYVTETHQEVGSGAGTHPTYTSAFNNDANARYMVDMADQCGIDVSPVVNVQNTGNNDITSLTIDYSVNGGPTETYNWTGNIVTLGDEDIVLPAISYTIGATNTVDISLPNDENNANNDVTGSFGEAPEALGNITMILNTGTTGAQTTWDLVDSSGAVLYSGGPYSNNQSINVPMQLAADCHEFNVYDSGGDGGASLVIYDPNNTVLYSTSGDYGAGEAAWFSSNGVLGLNDNVLEGVSIYPNPARTTLNVKNAENSNIEVYNMLGQVLYTKTNISLDEQINVSSFVTGTYFVKLTNGSAVKTSKFIVTK